MKTTLIDRFMDLFADLTGKNRFDRPDFVLLKTMMMLAAMDGEITEDEIGRFKELAEKCRGYNGEAFGNLWSAAVRSAGYLLLQSRLLGQEELVSAFVAEAEKDFVGEVVLETAAERARAFESLERMATADGDYSDIERASISALAAKVKDVREKMLAERYPRGAKFDRPEQETRAMKKVLMVAAGCLSAVMSGCTDIGSCGTSGMVIDGLNTCSAPSPQRLTGKDGTVFACSFKADGRFHFRFDVKDENVCVAKEVKHPLDIANGDRVEVYFVPDAQMKAGYRCAEIDADGKVLSYSVDEKKNYDWFWKFATLECSARRTSCGYEVVGSVAVDELKSFGINPDDFYLGVFRADMSEPGKVATWCAAAPMLLPAHFHQCEMMIRCTAKAL